MKRYIKSSNDITEYRGYQITNLGDEFEVVDLSTGNVIDYVDDITQAQYMIDQIFRDKAEEDRQYHQRYALQKDAVSRFIDHRDLQIDEFGNVSEGSTMSNPHRGAKRIPVDKSTLTSMVKSWNKHHPYSSVDFKVVRLEPNYVGFKLYAK